MRQAPPVRVRGSGGRIWRMLCAGLPALSLGVLLFWLQQQLLPAGDAVRVLVAAAAAGICARLLWRRQPGEQDLAWDGSSWTVDGTPGGRLQVMLDLGPWLLLRLRAEAAGHPPRAAVRWLPLSAREAGAHWPALRAAVYSRAPLPDPASTPPAAPARRPTEHPSD
jgi:hypothetical protein